MSCLAVKLCGLLALVHDSPHRLCTFYLHIWRKRPRTRIFQWLELYYLLWRDHPARRVSDWRSCMSLYVSIDVAGSRCTTHLQRTVRWHGGS